MITRRSMLAAGAAALGLAGMPGPALADACHGFDPRNVGPVRPGEQRQHVYSSHQMEA